MQFNLLKSIEILERTPSAIETLLSGISDEWLMNNEGENTWSPYDVVGHLIHGEKTDWIPRAKIILSDAEDKTFVPFDRFAQMNSEVQASMESLLQEFKKLRTENLSILKNMNLQDHQFDLKGIHPELGEAKLKELLSAWVTHDLGHIAQICRVMTRQYKSEVGPWKAFLSILS